MNLLIGGTALKCLGVSVPEFDPDAWQRPHLL